LRCLIVMMALILCDGHAVEELSPLVTVAPPIAAVICDL
jgi:hypothetical protein